MVKKTKNLLEELSNLSEVRPKGNMFINKSNLNFY